MENVNLKEKKKGMFHGSTSSGHRSRPKPMKGVVIHKGWLRRKPRISGYWRNRYFVLTEYEKEGGLVMDIHSSEKHLDDPSRSIAIPKNAKVSPIDVEKSIRVGMNKKQTLYSFFVYVDIDESSRRNLLAVAAASKEDATSWKTLIEGAISRMVVIAPPETDEQHYMLLSEDVMSDDDDDDENQQLSSPNIKRKSSSRAMSFDPTAQQISQGENNAASSSQDNMPKNKKISKRKYHFSLINRASAAFYHGGNMYSKAFEKEDSSMSRNNSPDQSIGKKSGSKWRVVTVTDGVQIFGEKDFKKYYPQLRATVEVSASAKDAIKLILDDSQRLQWDDSLESYEVVRNISSIAQLVYVKLKPFWIGALWVGSRDLIMLRHWREDPLEDNPNDFMYTVVWQSIDDSEYSKSAEGYTRGRIFSMAFTVKPLSSNTSLLEASCHADPGGAMSWMPRSVIQKWIQPFMLSVLGIRKLLNEKSNLAVISEDEKKDEEIIVTTPPKEKTLSVKISQAEVAQKIAAIPPSESETLNISSSTEEVIQNDKEAVSEEVKEESSKSEESIKIEELSKNEVSNESITTEPNVVTVAADTPKPASVRLSAGISNAPASIPISVPEPVIPKRPIYTTSLKGSFPQEFWMPTPENDPFPIRSKTYLTDSKKLPSDKYKFDLIAVNIEIVDTQIPHIAARSDSLTWALKEKYPDRFQFIIQFLVGEYSFALYFAARPGVLDDGSSFAELFHDFIEGTNEYRDNRFKFIPRVSKGSWILKKAVGNTPTIMGKKLTQQYYPGPHYFEVDINVNSSSVAESILGLVKGYATALEIDLCFLLEAQTEEELPEYIMGSVRLINPDLRKVTKMGKDPNEELTKKNREESEKIRLGSVSN